MAKPQFIKLYASLWYHPDVKNLKDSTFRFLIYILLKSWSQSENKNIFKIKPKEIYKEFNTSHSKLWRIQKELNTLKIGVEYLHNQYVFNLTEFFKNYYPNHLKNETVNNSNYKSHLIEENVVVSQK